MSLMPVEKVLNLGNQNNLCPACRARGFYPFACLAAAATGRQEVGLQGIGHADDAGGGAGEGEEAAGLGAGLGAGAGAQRTGTDPTSPKRLLYCNRYIFTMIHCFS